MTDANPVANNDLTALLVAFDDCLRVLRHAPADLTSEDPWEAAKRLGDIARELEELGRRAYPESRER